MQRGINATICNGADMDLRRKCLGRTWDGDKGQLIGNKDDKSMYKDGKGLQRTTPGNERGCPIGITGKTEDVYKL